MILSGKFDCWITSVRADRSTAASTRAVADVIRGGPSRFTYDMKPSARRSDCGRERASTPTAIISETGGVDV